MHITLNIYIPKQKKIPDFGTKDQFIKYEYHCYSSCPCAPSTSSRKQFKHIKNKQKVANKLIRKEKDKEYSSL